MSPEVDSVAAPMRGPVALVRGLYARSAHLVHEIGKFGVVGTVCYGIDIAIFAFCRRSLTMSWFPALVISTIIAATVAFAGNRYWTWRHSERGALHRAYGLYFGFNLVGLAISAVILLLTHNALGNAWPWMQTAVADLIFGKVIGVGLASLFRFWAYRRFVFRPAVSDV